MFLIILFRQYRRSMTISIYYAPFCPTVNIFILYSHSNFQLLLPEHNNINKEKIDNNLTNLCSYINHIGDDV